MSQPDFYAILDECVSRLRRGEAQEACLADYPAFAAQLAPDLAMSAELLQLSPLEASPDAVAAGHEKMMAALDSQETAARASLSAMLGQVFAPLRQRQSGLAATALRAGAIAVVVLVIAGSLVVTAAADTLPGDPLYPVKRSWENARLTLTIDDTSRQALQSQFERRRREEVQAVLDLRRPVIVEFNGQVESLNDGIWQVDGLQVAVTADTQVVGVAAVGQRVEVRAQVQDDGSLQAITIVVHDAQPAPSVLSTATPRPTQTIRPTPSATETRNTLAPSPTPTPTNTQPAATTTDRNTDRPTREPTSTPTASVDIAPTVEGSPSVDSSLTRDPLPTSTRPADSLATSAPRPTASPPKTDEPTATKRPVDVAPTPTPTSKPTRDKNPAPTPTATRITDTWDGIDRPP